MLPPSALHPEDCGSKVLRNVDLHSNTTLHSTTTHITTNYIFISLYM